MATALGVQAIEHHRKKVRFFATADLVNALEQGLSGILCAGP
jgi:DNA replication protein DnaC